MFNFNKTVDPTPDRLNQVIDKLLILMEETDPLSAEYATLADQLSVLTKNKETLSPKLVSPDTLAVIAGNIAVAVLILNYEQMHVVTTKALGFVIKSIVK